MAWIIGLLTFVLVVDCLLLILLVLIQLPKKEAGLGQAFGSAATDALFGAGSGTALTKMTKYATGVFLAVTMLLAILNAQHSKTRNRGFEEQMKEAGKTMEAPPAPVTPATTKPVTPAGTNLAEAPATNIPMLLTPGSNATKTVTNTMLLAPTNAPAVKGSNPPAKAP